MGKWSELPVNLLMGIEKHLGSNDIEDRLGLCIDKIRLRTVCVLWRFYLPKIPSYQQHQFPWLLQALDSTKDASHGLFNPIVKKVYEIDLPEAQGRLFKGSSYGWLATVEDNSTGPAIYLLNPITKSRIKLPPRNKFPDVVNYRPDKIRKEYAILYADGKRFHFFDSHRVNTYLVHKIVLSSTPSRDDCVVVAIYGQFGSLAYCKCKDKKWNSICQYGESYADVIFHKGKLHALKIDGTLIVIENIGPNAKVTEIASPPPNRVNSDHLYLVESSGGELIMVVRSFRSIPKEGLKWYCLIFKTYGFRVYKHNSRDSSWFLVKNLGDDTLFVGYNSSFSISSSSCHGFSGYLRNCIYFTDNLSDYHLKGIKGGSDIGVCNLNIRRIEQLSNFKCDPNHVWPPPLWVTPSPY
ncbi:hypothetical protein LguiA_013883 [Lonicera macranthoides]